MDRDKLSHIGPRIAIENPDQPEIIRLLRDGEAHSAELYPAESNHHLPLEALRQPNVRFFVARANDGRPVATGALMLNGDWAELKRMWVVPSARGRGVSKAMLGAIEALARQENVRLLRLETGVASDAALGLYAGAGFRRRGPFGEYRPDPLSVFMEKQVS